MRPTALPCVSEHTWSELHLGRTHTQPEHCYKLRCIAQCCVVASKTM